MNISRIGLDTAKTVFQIHGVDQQGGTVLRKTLRRSQVLPFFANLPACLIGLEACAGSHYWARELIRCGHEARLISPQFVKPYLKGNKNDANDAEAICEALGRPNMRFVPVKTAEQQDILLVHRVRQGLVTERTALVNRLRGLLGEYGIVLPQGIAHVRCRLPEVLEEAEQALSSLARSVLSDLYRHLQSLDSQVHDYDTRLQALYRASSLCQRLGDIPGVGPVTATAMVAALGDGRAFENGRQVSAWLGIVPRQDSSGGKPRLLGISKRGDTYLRTLLIHGARARVRAAARKDDADSRWINELVRRRNHNIATVAVANKNARIIWALLTGGEAYRPRQAQAV